MNLVRDQYNYLLESGLVYETSINGRKVIYHPGSNKLLASESVGDDESEMMRLKGLIEELKNSDGYKLKIATIFSSEFLDIDKFRKTLNIILAEHHIVEVFIPLTSNPNNIYYYQNLSYEFNFKVKLYVLLDTSNETSYEFQKLNRDIIVPIYCTGTVPKQGVKEYIYNFEFSESDVISLQSFDNKFVLNTKGIESEAIFADILLKLCEPNSNWEVFKSVIKYLTYKGTIKNEIYLPNKSEYQNCESSICGQCWAKNICWTSKLFMMFSPNPFETSQKKTNCETIRSVASHCINIAYKDVSFINKLEQQQIQSPDFSIKLINP